MGQAELLIAGLLVAVTALGALARYLPVPYRIVLVVARALFGFIPGLPKLDRAAAARDYHGLSGFRRPRSSGTPSL